MNPDRWKQIETLYHEASQCAPAERAHFLSEQCADDDELRQEVNSLLNASDQSGAMRDSSPFFEAGIDIREVLREHGPDPLIGTHIGRYRIVSHVASGGMGSVYEAEQEQPRRRVALKLMSWGINTAETRARFDVETEILGRLEHPAIARIYDAGFHDIVGHQVPWFAMEYVDGLPIAAHIRKHELSTRATLRMFISVCDAVHYAHTRGVIHRDLKPGNILVDESGQPRVLDFGVARATDADLQATTIRTDVGQLVGTIPYMSPEQAAGASRDIDTRSDVYALGVLIYELLAGRLPYEVSGKPVYEAVRIVREVEPAPLSSVSRVFRGDLDTIIRRALEKNPERRYQSVLEMAADVHRYLNSEPILARRPSTTYQLRKFARRHRGLVIGLAAVLLILIGAIATISASLAHSVRAEHEAQEQARITDAINRFLLDDLLAAADPDRAFEPDVRLREVLDVAALHIDERFPDAPGVRAQLHRTVGSTYLKLGDSAEAFDHLSIAADILADQHPVDQRELLTVGLDMAMATWGMGRPQDANDAMSELIREAEQQLDEDDDLVSTMHSKHALVLEELGDFEDADAAHHRAINAFTRKHGSDDIRTVDALNGLANLRMQRGHFEEAETLFLDVLAGREQALGTDHPRVSVSRGNLAELYRRMRRYEESYELFQALRESDLQMYGADHPRTLTGTNNYALLCRDMGKLDEAEELFTELVMVRRQVRGPHHLSTLIAEYNLALVHIDKQEFNRADRLLAEIEPIAAEVLGTDNWYTGIFISKRAFLQMEQMNYGAARPHAERAQPILEAQLGDANMFTVANMSYLWRIAKSEGREDDAATWLSRIPEQHHERLIERERTLMQGETDDLESR